jgi:hypothetical protein
MKDIYGGKTEDELNQYQEPDWSAYPDQEFLMKITAYLRNDNVSNQEISQEENQEVNSQEEQPEETLYEEDEFSSDESIQSSIEKIDLAGNIVPCKWFHQLRTGKGNKERPYYEAIAILSEIVYWYRPSKTTGKKKYQDDLLQLSYGQIAERFGMSKGAAKAACDYLEELGVIKRVFRNFTTRGRHLSNVMYVELFIDRLYEITKDDDE